jgi:hypothetical protein
MNASFDTRLRAIFCCLWFGILPSWVYEPVCHYRRGYFRHCKLNLQQVWVWLSFSEKASSIDFELEINRSWGFVFSKLFRWQAHSCDKQEFRGGEVIRTTPSTYGCTVQELLELHPLAEPFNHGNVKAAWIDVNGTYILVTPPLVVPPLEPRAKPREIVLTMDNVHVVPNTWEAV